MQGGQLDPVSGKKRIKMLSMSGLTGKYKKSALKSASHRFNIIIAEEVEVCKNN